MAPLPLPILLLLLPQPVGAPRRCHLAPVLSAPGASRPHCERWVPSRCAVRGSCPGWAGVTACEPVGEFEL